MGDSVVVVVPPSTPSVVVVPASTAAVTPSTVNVSGTSIGPAGRDGHDGIDGIDGTNGTNGLPGIVASSSAPSSAQAVFWADTNEPGYEAVPPGGLANQILKKRSDADYDYDWSNLGSGTVTSITTTSPLTGGPITSSGSIGIQDASTTQKGAVQLTNATNSTSVTTAATPNSVKTAYDLASTANTAAGTAQATADSAVTAAGNAQTAANNKVASVSGTGAISVTSGTTPQVSVALASTSVIGVASFSNSNFSVLSGVVSVSSVAGSSVSGDITGNAANVTSTVVVGKGGTGATTFATSGVLVGNGTSALSATSAPTSTTRVLVSDSSGYVPVYGMVDLANNTGMVTGLLGLFNGGTNASSAAAALTNLSGASLVASNAFTVGGHTIAAESATVKPLVLKAFGNQTADQIEYQSIANTVYGGANAVGQFFTGSTAPLSSGSISINQAVVTSTNVTYTTTATNYYAVNDLVNITGITTAQGLPATTYVVISSTPTPTSFVANVTTGTAGTYTGLTGTAAVPAQTSITPRSAGTKGLVVKGYPSSGTNTFEVQTSAGTATAWVNQSNVFVIANLSIPNIRSSVDDSLTAYFPGTKNTILGGTGIASVTGTGVVGISNATNVPTGAPTGGGILYVTGGALTYRGAGSAKTIVTSAGLLDLTAGTITGVISVGNGGTSATNGALAINILESGVGLSTVTTSTDVSTTNATAIKNIVCNSTAAITLTLQSPAGVAGREYYILSKNTGNVLSGTSNVLTRSGSVATTGILTSGVAGSWAKLVSDGTYYQIMSSS